MGVFLALSIRALAFTEEDALECISICSAIFNGNLARMRRIGFRLIFDIGRCAATVWAGNRKWRRAITLCVNKIERSHVCPSENKTSYRDRNRASNPVEVFLSLENVIAQRVARWLHR